MKKLYFLPLYIVLLFIAAIMSWFMYVGPITTYNVKRIIKAQKQTIVISLTTTPYRIDKIKTTLDSILAQSIKADKIFLNVPYTFRRDNAKYIIPAWLKDYRGIIINRSDDFGPITKLIPTLLQQDLPADAIVITVDDDHWYPRHVVRDLVNYSMQHPTTAITVVNLRLNLDINYQFAESRAVHYYKHASRAPLVIGVGGVAYRKSFFNQRFINMLSTLPAPCQLSDDLVISMYLAHENIPIEQCMENSLNPIVAHVMYQPLAHRLDSSALSYGNGDFLGSEKNYNACLSQLADGEHSQYRKDFIQKSFEIDLQNNKIGFWGMLITMLS